MALNEKEKQRLLLRVAEVEAGTGAEIVMTVVARCDHYPEIPWKAFAWGVSLGVGALALGRALGLDGPWASVGPAAALVLGAGLAVLLLTLAFMPLARLFLARERAAGEVEQYAEALFLREELFRTKARNGILLLVALFERRVFILPDRGIRERGAAAGFDGIVASMAPALAAGDVGRALETGLSRLEAALRAHGFTRGGGVNELPDSIEERPGT
jgi:putative membrane protein